MNERQCWHRFPLVIATTNAMGPNINPRINHVSGYQPLFSAAKTQPTANITWIVVIYVYSIVPLLVNNGTDEL
jgi:hypothetical protein